MQHQKNALDFLLAFLGNSHHAARTDRNRSLASFRASEVNKEALQSGRFCIFDSL
jgi:hypothetical protein